MQDPAGLYRIEADPSALVGHPGVLIVSLGGFIDAGGTSRLLAEHLLRSGESEVIASFDVDQLLDYRGRRPVMVFDTNRYVSYDDPSILLHRLRDRDGQAYYLLHGSEPDFQWERFVDAVGQLIRLLGITLVATTHGIPMAVPHTRPLGLTAHATSARLIGDARSPFGQVQLPGSVAALLELRRGELGEDALGFAVHVPHYLAQADFHEAALTALNALVDATGLNLPNDDLVAASADQRAQIAAEVAGNAEVQGVVGQLETAYDNFVQGQERPSLLAGETAIPSADELGADIEEFLRHVERGDH